MDTRVYINNREACSKASDGVSKVAFPDPAGRHHLLLRVPSWFLILTQPMPQR